MAKRDDLVLTALEVTDSALRKLGVLEAGGVSSSNQRTTAREALNVICKSFDAMSDLKYAVNSVATTLNSVAGTSSYSVTAAGTSPIAWVESVLYTVNGRDKILTMLSAQEYARIPDKGRKGVPSHAFVSNDLGIPQDNPIASQVVYLWPTPIANVTGGITLYSRRKIQRLSEDADELDLPDEWTNYLIWKLTADLSFEYRLPLEERGIIAAIAEKSLQALLPVQVAPIDGTQVPPNLDKIMPTLGRIN